MKHFFSQIRNFFQSNLKLAFSLAFLAVFSATTSLFAAFTPGQTLDPNCTPGSAGCTVQILPTQTGNNGKFLTTDGTTTSWGSVVGMGIGNAVTSGTSGSILFVDSSNNLAQDNTNFTWDNTNKALNLNGAFFAKQDTVNANLSVGKGAMNGTTSGLGNTAIGTDTLLSNTTGQLNTAIGAAALFANTIGNNNTAVGVNGLASNDVGVDNTTMGAYSLNSNTSGDFNTAFGSNALFANIDGDANSATGYQSLLANTTGFGNVGYGYQSLLANTTGNFNTALGVSALTLNTTGSNNIGIGYATGIFSPVDISNSIMIGSVASATASNQLVIGASEGAGLGKIINAYFGQGVINDQNEAIQPDGITFNATGAFGLNTAGGNFTIAGGKATGNAVGGSLIFQTSDAGATGTTLQTLTTKATLLANGNFGIGVPTPSQQLEITGNFALPSTTATSGIIYQGGITLLHTLGGSNFFAGLDAGNLTMTGGSNTAVGFRAFKANTTGDKNVAVGTGALNLNTTGVNNTANGYFALGSNTSGGQNIAVGYQALTANTTGLNNTAVGYQALTANTTLNGNTAMGYQSLLANTGGDNTAVGMGAMLNNTTGNFNTAIGFLAGSIATTFDSSISVGYGSVPTASNQLVMGGDSGGGTGKITQAYFGQGVTNDNNSGVQPTGITFNTTGAVGTDTAGGNFTFAGGKATGNALGGNLIFQTSVAGGTGTTLQSLTTKMFIDSLGLVNISNGPAWDTGGFGNEATGKHLNLGYDVAGSIGYIRSVDILNSFTDLRLAGSSISLWTAPGGVVSERLTILSGGNVGIGTNIPASFLDIDSSIIATNNNQVGGLTVRTSITGRATTSDTVLGIKFSPTLVAGANTQSLTTLLVSPTYNDNSKTGVTHYDAIFNGGGNVGIGTTTPGEKLVVVGNIISKGTAWTSRTGSVNNQWLGVTYGNGLFVAVAINGTGDGVMTSPDGINWTSRTSAADNSWTSVTYGNGLFVAVASSGTGNRVMTSPNGITWTSRTGAPDDSWNSVTYGNGLFVAVSGNGNVMTSPDGITWTSRTSAASNNWRSVTYGNGLFVAVSNTCTGDCVMTSPDGITWTSRVNSADNDWRSVTYGNGLFVAVSVDGTGNRVMTSPDGITWTSRTSAVNNQWLGVTYGNGLFVAVSNTGTGDRVMTSSDGITWTSRTSAVNNPWMGVTYGNGVFVAVAQSGASDVMTSGKTDYIPFSANNLYQGGLTITGDTTLFNLTTDNAGGSDHYLCITTAGQIVTRGTTCGGSSQRWKHDITDLDAGLNELLQFHPVSFRYNDTNDLRLGLIAEEVNTIDPRLVFYDEDGTTPRGINYQDITPILIKSVQEIDLRLKGLETLDDGTGNSKLKTLITQFLADAGEKIINGIVRVKDIIAETITANTVKTNGVEFKDTATGQIYCVVITNGDFAKTAGECGTISPITIPSSNPDPTPTTDSIPLSDSTPPSDTPPVDEAPPAAPDPSPIPDAEPASEPAPDPGSITSY
ncbi:MAG: tail fiber domain-containing protein [Candidatus Paceibacterota bacterium]